MAVAENPVRQNKTQKSGLREERCYNSRTPEDGERNEAGDSSRAGKSMAEISSRRCRREAGPILPETSRNAGRTVRQVKFSRW